MTPHDKLALALSVLALIISILGLLIASKRTD